MCVLLTFLRSSCSPALVAPPLFRSSSHRRPSRCRPPRRCSCYRSHPHRFTLGLSSHRSSFVVALARRRLCPTAHGCPVAPLRRSSRWHCHTSIDDMTLLLPSLFSFRFATFVFWQKIRHGIDHPRRNLEPILEATLESYPIGAILEAYVHVIKWSSDHMFN